MKKKYEYFVSFVIYDDNDNHGFGNTMVKCSHKVSSQADIEYMAKEITRLATESNKIKKVKCVIVLNYQLLNSKINEGEVEYELY